jgi:myo-inositol-1(or 4)-monophosphatase
MDDEYLDFAKELALDAGEIMMHYYEIDEKGITIKDDQTPVTLVDTKINSLVISKVKNKYPGHGVLGEEESYNLQARKLWVVDPLDGTSDFANHIPDFAFSIAFVEDGISQVGVIYNPVKNRFFYATAGKGAYENDRRISLASNAHKQTLNISSWVVGGIDNSVFKDTGVGGNVAELYAKKSHINVSDYPIAYALALVASGDLDAVVSSIKTPWDVAAGSLIAHEAGAKVTDIFGSSNISGRDDANGILAGVSEIHNYLLEIIGPVLVGQK